MEDASLAAMLIEVPKERSHCVNGTIAVLNIDSTVRNAFPSANTDEYKPFVGRVVSVLKRINRLGR